MRPNHQHLLGVFAIAFAFASSAQAEYQQYVTSSLNATSDRSYGITLNGIEFVLGGSNLGSSAKMEAAGFDQLSFTHDWSWVSSVGTPNYAYAIGTDSLGRILLAGANYPVYQKSDFAIARLRQTSPGVYALDPTFTTGSPNCASGYPAGFCDSKLGSNTFSVARAMVVDSTDRIIAAGNSGSSGVSGTVTFAIARYTTDGHLDHYTVSPIPGYSNPVIMGLAKDSSGNFVAVGQGNNGNNGCFARYLGTTLAADPSFVGGNGTVSPATGIICVPNSVFGSSGYTSFNSVAIDSAGNIVVAGTTLPPTGHRAMLLARFTPTGARDLSFAGGNGYLILQPRPAAQQIANAVQIDPLTGEIVVAGTAASWVRITVSPTGSMVDSSTFFTLPGSHVNDATGLVLTPQGALMGGSTDAPSGNAKWNFAGVLF